MFILCMCAVCSAYEDFRSICCVAATKTYDRKLWQFYKFSVKRKRVAMAVTRASTNNKKQNYENMLFSGKFFCWWILRCECVPCCVRCNRYRFTLWLRFVNDNGEAVCPCGDNGRAGFGIAQHNLQKLFSGIIWERTGITIRYTLRYS